MAHAKTEFRLLMSPITRTVFAGRVRQLEGAVAQSVGVRHDVTNDFLALVIQYSKSYGGNFEITAGGDAWDVIVTKREAQAAANGEHAS